jgi:hypothetical protein
MERERERERKKKRERELELGGFGHIFDTVDLAKFI